MIWIKFGKHRNIRQTALSGQTDSSKQLQAVRRIGAFLIFLLTIISCNNNDTEIKEFLNSGNEEILENLENQNTFFFINFEGAYAENPTKVKPYKDKVDSIYEKYCFFVEYKDKYFSELKEKKKLDFKSYKFYNEMFISNADTIKLYLLLCTKSDSSLNIKLTQILDFEVYKYKKLSEFDVNLLNLKLINAINLTLDFLYSKIESEKWLFNFIKPFVIPENYRIKQGENYNATIGYAKIDTTKNPLIIVNNDTLLCEKGIAKYSFKPSKTGFYNFYGNIDVQSPATGEMLRFPFDIKFKVLE